MTPERPIRDLLTNLLSTGPEARLITRQSNPDNHEFPVHSWWSWLSPNPLFYVRSHFPVPALDPATWRLVVDGEVEQPLSFSLADLRVLPRRRHVVTLECAGNRRTEFEPCPAGVPWQDGAVSSAEWEGISLADLLALTRPKASARELLLEGADRGTLAGHSSPIPFARSLPLERALHPDVLLADQMNGEPLPSDHGAPIRAVVPGGYGMDSVKWLVRLSLLDRPFEGHFQINDYRLFPAPGSAEAPQPIGPVRVNSLIAWPPAGQELPVGEEIRIAGYAWSGHAPIRQVALSVDGGETWRLAELVGPEAPYAWRLWQLSWRPSEPGNYSLRSRATDAAGNTQPEQVEWNLKGYANNRRRSVPVRVG